MCALGDSIFAGYMVDGKSLIYYLQKKGFDIDNYGVNGLTSGELLNQLKNIKSYDVFLIHIGMNDFLNGYSVDRVISNIVDIIKMLMLFNARIIFCSPYKISFETVSESLRYFEQFNSVNAKLFELNDFFKVLESKNYINLISFYDLSEKKDIGKYLLDGIHPDKELHQILADYSEDYLNEYLWYFERKI